MQDDEKSVNLKLIIHEILEDYALPIHGDHGHHFSASGNVFERFSGLEFSGDIADSIGVDCQIELLRFREIQFVELDPNDVGTDA